MNDNTIKITIKKGFFMVIVLINMIKDTETKC